MSNKIKVLILSDYAFTKGGAEKVAITSSIGLAERGHKVVFFSAVGPVCSELKEAPMRDIICLDQKDILDNPNKFNAMINGIYNQQAVRELKKNIIKYKPDIIHVHGVSKALSWGVFNIIYSSGIPVIYTLHDYGLICPNLGIYDFKKEENCPYYKPEYGIKCLAVNCDKRNYMQKFWRWTRFQIVRKRFKLNKKVDGYIAVSDFLKQMIKKNLPFCRQIRTIYNPIETESSRNDCKINRKRNNFIFVGRLSREKGIDILLEAAGRVKAGFTIIGDGELANWVNEAQKKHGKNKINFLGYQSKKVIYREMKSSIALVLPSRCMEPAPLVIGEAAYNHLPTIAADHGGLTEFVDDGVNGVYFKAGDVNSLIRSLECFIYEPEKSMELGKKAYDIINNLGLDLDTHLDKIVQYYTDILDRGSLKK